MDRAQGLTSDSDNASDTDSTTCPGCGADSGPLSQVEVGLFRDASLRRCVRCGERWSSDDPVRLTLRPCPACALPFLIEQKSDRERCEDCLAGRYEIEGSDLSAATEGEVRSALAEAWAFVGSDRTNEYLDRVAREIARGIDNAPLDCRVLLVREKTARALALSSGVILLSEGLLHALEDEAELAFVLGRELAHAAASEGDRPLIGLGLRALSEGTGEGAGAWVRAVLDRIRLGQGDDREHDADARAVVAMISVGYDPTAATRYLQRVHEHAAAGDEPFAEMVFAHPPAKARLQRLEGHLVRPGAMPDRVNREVFRRMAGHTVLASELVPVLPFDGPADPAAGSSRPSKMLVWVALVIAALGALWIALGVFRP